MPSWIEQCQSCPKTPCRPQCGGDDCSLNMRMTEAGYLQSDICAGVLLFLAVVTLIVLLLRKNSKRRSSMAMDTTSRGDAVRAWVQTLKNSCFILLLLGSSCLGFFEAVLGRLMPSCPYFSVVWSLGVTAYLAAYTMLVLVFSRVEGSTRGPVDIRRAQLVALGLGGIYGVVTVLFWLMVVLPNKRLVSVGELGTWAAGFVYLLGLQVTVIRILLRVFANRRNGSSTKNLLALRSQAATNAEARMRLHLSVSLLVSVLYDVCLTFYIVTGAVHDASKYTICQYLFYLALAIQHINVLTWLEPRTWRRGGWRATMGDSSDDSLRHGNGNGRPPSHGSSASSTVRSVDDDPPMMLPATAAAYRSSPPPPMMSARMVRSSPSPRSSTRLLQSSPPPPMMSARMSSPSPRSSERVLQSSPPPLMS